MASIPQIKVGNDIFTIKDPIARKKIENAITCGRNKFNKYSLVNGKYVESTHGYIIDNPYYSYTDELVDIKSNTKYKINSQAAHVVFYNDASIFISGVANSTSFTTPNNAKFIRISVPTNDVDTIYVYEYNDTSDYEPFGYKFKHEIEDNSSEILIDEIKKIENKISYRMFDNLVDKTNLKRGYFLYYENNIEMENSSFEYTFNYLPIEPSTTYSCTLNQQHVCFYNSSKQFISGVYVTGNSFTTPAETAYFRISFSISNENVIGVFSSVSGNVIAFVDKEGGGDFTSLTEASRILPEGSVIIVRPGIYEDEIVTGCWSKKQYIIGVSAKDCIIKNHTGDYSYPPIQIGAGLLRNLTFHSEKRDGETYPQHKSYAVHVESNTLYNDNLIVENCIIISDFMAGLGMGMRGGCHVVFKNCEFISNANQEAVYVHDADDNNYTGEQHLEFINCIMYSPICESTILLQSQEKQDSMIYLKMINNRLKNAGETNYRAINYYGGTGGEDDFLGLINWRQNELSWGNSLEAFND